jgi:serine/threonine-protein kinase RsbW
MTHARGRYPVNRMSEAASAHSADGLDLVEVTVPLRTDFIATLRTVSASLGADAGFSIDEIDDLRLAISEIVSSMIDSTTSTEDRIVASFEVGTAGVSVVITTERGEIDIELDDLAASILESVVDEYVVEGPRVNMVKLASEAASVVEADVERTAHER